MANAIGVITIKIEKIIPADKKITKKQLMTF